MDSITETECLVFSTSLREKNDVKILSELLNELPGMIDWSVDLDDWEKVLRIECVGLSADIIKKYLRKKGVYIRELPM